MDLRVGVVLGLFAMAVNGSGYFFVTAPNMLRYKTDENVLVSVFDRSDADITIWLEYDYFINGDIRTNQFSRKTVRVLNQENPRLETIRVDENDVFDPEFDETTEKPGQLRLVASDGNTQKHVDIMLSYDSGYLIVHTDKPIYTPRQKVSVRVLALDESMSNALALDKTDTKRQVVMDLVSPSGKIMSRAYGKPSNNKDKTPFYTREFDIPANTELGTWTVVTHFTGQFETSERTLFEVEEYVLPTMNVMVTTSISYILETTEHFQVTVEAKSVYQKPVAGSVGLTFFLNNEEDQEPILNQPRTHLSFEKGVYVFTINAKDIVNSNLRNDKTFPFGQYLTIRADVYESATGYEEKGWNTEMIFADKPYKFTYERSKLHFRPGWVYFFKVDVLLPNGDKANNVEIQVNFKQGEMVNSKLKSTDNIGQCNIPFSTKGSTQTDISFEINVDGVIDTFVVKQYKGANQVQVDNIERENKVWISMKNNMDWRATGLLFVIMSRGKIIEWKYTDPTNEHVFELEKEILTKITPNARVLVFYVDNNAVVADSVKFDVEAVCRGKELKLTTVDKEVDPGQPGQLTIEGPSDMIVGLNVMDTALLQLNSENILRRIKMFKAMASHDRGCGEGSGSTVEEVFKYSGLTLVTDAVIAIDKLKRTYVNCPKNNRRKRSLGVSSRTRRSSLDGKSEYNIDLETLRGSRPRQRNDFSESWLFADVDLEDGKVKVVLKYPDSITQWMIQAIGFSPRDGICIANPLYVNAYRDFFIQLDLPYQAVRLERINVKATIFNYGYRGQDDKTINVYLHGQKDMCSAARPGQTSDKVQLIMAPNTVQTVAFPFIPLKRSTPGKQLSIEVTAIAEGTLVNDAISKSLYIINEGIEKRKTIHVCLDPGREKNDCESSSNNVLESYHNNTNKKLQTITIDLSLPKDAIPDTGSAIAYIKSNMMLDAVETIVNGIDKLLRIPYGSGESIMLYLGPTTYAMDYLKQTNQVTDKIEQDGNYAIRNGVTQEMKFRKLDGSYAAWLCRHSSTLLTAFVAKVFCQAKTVVDDTVNDALHIAPTVDWIAKQILADGSFDDKLPVRHREMIGQVSEKDETLTAFVLISLLECQKKTNIKAKNEVTKKAQKYIESLDENHLLRKPYLLTISAYALSLTDSSEKGRFLELLKNTKHTNGGNTYWGDITPPGTVADANTVETTSYALLTYLSYNEVGEAGHIVRWLTSQRNAEGSFRTTQDTVVGLQALSEYSIVTSSKELNLQLTFSADGWDKSGQTETVTKENINVLKIVENLPVEIKHNQLVIDVTGSGSALMDIDLRYNIPKPDASCAFEVSEIDIKPARYLEFFDLTGRCDVCGYCKESDNHYFDAFEDEHNRKDQFVKSKKIICMSFSVSLRSADQPESGMSIVRVNLQTGMQAVEMDLKKLLMIGIIDRYELTYNRQGFIVFYLNKIGHDAKEFKFRLIDEFDGDTDTRHGSSVELYDYYRPDRSCQITYGFGNDRGPLEAKCSGEYKQACNCVQILCTLKPDLNYLKNTRKNKTTSKLIKRTCNNAVADYSILVLITETYYDYYEKKAAATVLKVLNRGAEALVENKSEVMFTWKKDCTYPDFEKGKKYYVIAKDGPRTNTDGTTGYTYPLKDKAFVIEQMNRLSKDSTLRKVFALMNKYEHDMKNNGCYA